MATTISTEGNFKRRCFVIMPFSETTGKHTTQYWTDFFEHFIRPSVEALGYHCVRSDAGPKNIIQNIISELWESDVVLAVLTDANPNVWYELGVRHALRNGTILMIENGQKIPFDINAYGVIIYEDIISARMKFEISLQSFIAEVEIGKKKRQPGKRFYF